MTRTLTIALGLAAALLASEVPASNAAGATIKSSSAPSAGLAWRCGKNNPAEWGTFGTGCLKQKRQSKNR